MTVRCPEGHESGATDYCDICGTPIDAGAVLAGGSDDDHGSAGAGPTGSAAGAAAPGPALPGGPSPGSVLDLDPVSSVATQICPHCGGVNLEDALFCEACGYDFTTGAAPLDDEPPAEAEPDGDQADGAQPESDPPADPVSPGSGEEPADSDPPPATDGAGPEEPPSDPEPGEPPAADAPGTDEGDEASPPAEAVAPDDAEKEALDDNAQDEAGEADCIPGQPEPAAGPAPTAGHSRPRHTPPSRDLAQAWVMEVWVDPDWYAVQQTEEACPSAGVPDIVVVRRNVVLVGRPSGSLGVRPDVDAGADSAVSRRHAQLTSDGRRWWIEDLGSSNGTFVGVVGEPLPTKALTPGHRVEIDRDDRIYVGAWTRLVLRQATASEKAGQG